MQPAQHPQAQPPQQPFQQPVQQPSSQAPQQPLQPYDIPHNTVKKGSYLRWAPPILRALGIAIIVLIIAAMLPITIPAFAGMQMYSVTTGSMEPSIPVGSLVYVEPCKASDIPDGDVAAFNSGDTVIVHRVVQNQTVEGQLYTKGDANEKGDVSPVPYNAVIGKVTFDIPYMGAVYSIMSGWVGKAYAICLIVAGVLMCILAGQLTRKRLEIEGGYGQ